MKTLKKIALGAAASVAAFATPGGASAATVVSACDPALVSASDCSGYYGGNLLGGSPGMIANQIEGVAALDSDFTFDGNWSDVDATKITTLTDGMLDFGTMLYGETIIGIHFGNVAGVAGNVTAFYLFDFGTTGASSIQLADTQGFSNAVLYTTGVGAVPEPGVWMLMILAFGGIGFAMRRRSEGSARPAIA